MISTVTLNPVLRDFWMSPARNRVLYGGRASSKSWDAAGFVIFLAQTCKIRVLCTRQFQNRIADSVYTLLKIQAERFGIAHEFTFLESSIRHNLTGSEFIFYGLARNLSEIKSTEGVDIHWAEECHLMTKEQWETLNITVRKQGSQHWLIFNPRFQADYIYQRFVVSPPADTVVRKINYLENPFLSDTALAVIEDARRESEDDFRHIYLGEPLLDDERAIIKRSWLDAATDAHIKLGFEAQGQRIIGYDVADSGGDKNANVYAHGSVALWCEEWSGGEDELLKSCSRTYGNARARDAAIRYDSIGVGALVGGKVDELNKSNNTRIGYSKFNAGGAVFEPDRFYMANRMDKVRNKEFFSNLKAQAWWLIADRLRNTYDAVTNGTAYPTDELISIASGMPHIEKLKSELSTPRRDFDANGRVKVESKKDLAARDVASPNLADAFVMCFAPETKPFKINPNAAANLLGYNRR